MTPMAANGLQIDHDQLSLVAERASDLAGCIVKLLKNPDRRRKLGRAAWETVSKTHGWHHASDAFSRLLKQAMEPIEKGDQKVRPGR